MGTTAIVLAAGSGVRFGGELPKQLVILADAPIVVHSVRAFVAAPDVDDVVVVTSAALRGEVTEILATHGHGDLAVIEGGATRDASTLAALAGFADRADELLLIHDAVRPLIDQATIARCCGALASFDAAVAVDAMTDTIFEVAGDTLAAIPDRSGFRRAQTPQAFRAGVLQQAFDLALDDPAFATTDDIGVVHRYLPDVAIALVEGSPDNLKVTTPADLISAAAILATRN